MIQLKDYNVKIFFFFLIIFSLFLSGCANQQKSNQKNKSETPKQNSSQIPSEKQWKLPITIQEGEFYRVGGWVNNEEILYITNLGQESNVYRYNLMTGKSKFIYRSESPIVTIQLSPSKDFILIHSAPSSYEGLITIIDQQGKEKYKESIASYELDFEWNSYNESEVLVSKFDEDWSFQVYLLNINEKELKELSLPQPFVKWVDEKKIAFLNWDENKPSFYAPLMFRGLDNGIEETVFSSVMQFSAFSKILMAITVNEEDPSIANYAFYNQQMNQLFTFSIPQLTKFSDWLVPFYDYNEKKQEFVTLRPLMSGELDSYSDGFELAVYQLQNGTSTVLLNGLENEPISVSPSGEASLYGNQFEKIIDLNEKKIYDLVKE